MKKLTILALMLFGIKAYCQTSDFDKGLIAFDAKDFPKAISKLKPFANKGNCLAQYAVGFAYMYSTEQRGDSIARPWLLLAAEQKMAKAMGPLAVSYFNSGVEDAMVKAYMWAMLAAKYDDRQKFTTTRLVIKGYLKPGELEKAETLIKQYEEKWKNVPNCEQ